jgi:hypothetical protein
MGLGHPSAQKYALLNGQSGSPPYSSIALRYIEATSGLFDTDRLMNALHHSMET